MLDYLSRLVSGFEHAHGMHPNLLYINQHHLNQLKSSFDESITLQEIMESLEMDLVIDSYTTHPHVCCIDYTRDMRQGYNY